MEREAWYRCTLQRPPVQATQAAQGELFLLAFFGFGFCVFHRFATRKEVRTRISSLGPLFSTSLTQNKTMKSASIAAIPGVKEDDPRALFELGEKLGKGAFGAVYKARNKVSSGRRIRTHRD